MAMTNASNSSVKPLSARAQGTDTCLIPQLWQAAGPARAGVLRAEKSSDGARSSPLCHRPDNLPNRLPLAKSQVDVQPLGCGIEFALPHHHGGLTPSATCNKSVSRIAALPRGFAITHLARGRCPRTPGYLTHNYVLVVFWSCGTARDGDDRAR
jgi:hypothetical protein